MNSIKTIADLKIQLLKAYNIDTVNSKYKEKWNKNNPTYGQCAITSILVQNLFGGDIYKLEKENHYYNFINGEIIDLTKEQFDCELDYSSGIKRIKAFDEETMGRYKKLKDLLDASK